MLIRLSRLNQITLAAASSFKCAESQTFSRRTVVKGSALAGALAATAGFGSIVGCQSNDLVPSKKESGPSKPQNAGDASVAYPAVDESNHKIKWANCAVNCGSRCALQFHTRDNEVIYVETDNQGSPEFGDLQLRACPRGRSMRYLLNGPDRVNYPMKRVGKRGEGKFEKISWDEALDTIAEKITSISQKYGNEAIWISYASGIYAPTGRPWHRLLNQVGGYLNMYGSYSSAQITRGMPFTTGSKTASNIYTLEDAKLAVFFGDNLVEMRMGGAGNGYYYQHIREKNPDLKIIHIDPRYSMTASKYTNDDDKDQWIPIRPGTDSALVCAIVHVLITENMVDEDFLHKYCVGYDAQTMPEGYEGTRSYKDYILSNGEDKLEKTPKWAAPITGIPEDIIIALAKEIGTTKPLWVAQGLGPQRHSNGENTSRAIAMIPILTGQIGLDGTSTGAQEIAGNGPTIKDLPRGENPIKTAISCFDWPRAILEGEKMTATNGGVQNADKLSTSIKMLINHGGNCLTNQHGDINKMQEIFEDESKLEFILCSEIVMTDSAKYADIILPDLARSEQPNIGTNGYSDPVDVIFSGDEPLTTEKFERRATYDVCADIAERLGVKEAFTEGLDQRGWIKRLFEEAREKRPDFPTYEELQEMGVWKKPIDKVVGLKDFRDNPEANPLKTESGKIEIFSKALDEISKTWELPEGDEISALPEFYLGYDGYDSPRAKDYPFQLIGFHYKGRCHSSYANVEHINEAFHQNVWINPIDAEKLSIKTGDQVSVKNDIGEVHTEALVTPRIIPGTLAMAQGAWHDADMAGDKIDKGGCINTLVKLRPSPLAKGNPSHTNHVLIEKL